MFDITSPVRNFNRWREVQAILFRYGFGFLVDSKELHNFQSYVNRTLGIKLSLLPESELSKFTFPQRVRLMFQELGPTYIKLGQILSSRSDLLPPDWIHELKKLLDEIPAFPFEQAREIVEKEFGYSLEELFLDFDPEPIAAASIAQVHRATLLNHNPVVVKVRRPRITSQVQSDMEIIREVVRLIEGRTTWGKRLGLVSIIDEFDRTMKLEMDFTNEATNAVRLRRLSNSMNKVYVPYIYWDLTSEQVLTMEYIEGIKITDIEMLDDIGIDRSELADRFIRSTFKQLLIDGFYHADPHPGNLLVEPDTQYLVYLDLGQMGRLLPAQRQQFSDLARSILRRDSQDVARIIMTIGTSFDKVDEKSLQRGVDQIINRYLETSLRTISLSALLNDVLATIFKHNIRLPSELTLAFKTIIQAEEVGRVLDDQILVVDIMSTVARQVFWETVDPRNILESVGDSLREFNRLRGVVPRALESILKQLESGALTVALDIPDFNRITDSLIIISNRLVAGLIVAGMLVGSALVMSTPTDKTWDFFPILGMIAFLAASVFGFILVWSVVFEIMETARHKEKWRKKQ